jgi:hypothetical protein
MLSGRNRQQNFLQADFWPASVPNHDAAWTDYKRDAKELLANRNAGFFRSIFVPSLAPAITSSEKTQVFADALDQKLSQHRYGWPLLFSMLAPAGKARESAVANWSGLNPKGPGLLLYAMRPCESIK